MGIFALHGMESLATFGEEYESKRLERRQGSLNMVKKLHELAEVVQLSRGGSSSFEWSKDSEGWQERVVQSCMDSLGMKSVQFDGCAFDLELDGKRPKRQWIVQTTNERLVKEPKTKKFSHAKGFHRPLEGSLTKKSRFYTMSMAICFPFFFQVSFSIRSQLAPSCHSSLTHTELDFNISIPLKFVFWQSFTNCYLVMR